MITEGGLVYSWGNDIENTGLLAMNSLNSQPSPIRNHYFSDKKIESISISDKHAIAIDFNHQCFTWGSLCFYETLNCSKIDNSTIIDSTIHNIPCLINEGKLYIQKGKCGDSFIALLDFGGYLYYIGCLGSKSVNRRNSILMTSHKLIQFNYQEVGIKDFACGNNVIGILDTRGQFYLFNENEGLLKIKLDKEIGQIGIRKKCIYALAKDYNYIYVLIQPNTDTKIVDYVQNEFEINKASGQINIIDNGYYNTNTVFFSFESDYSRTILSNNQLNNIFKPIRSKKNINGIDFSTQWLRDDISLCGSVYPVNNSNLNRSNASISNISRTTKSKQRIERISNLLEVIFDKQIDKFNEKRSRSTKRRIEVENVVINYNSRHEYGFGFGKKDHKRESSFCSSKLRSILEEQDMDKYKDSNKDKKRRGLKRDDSNEHLFTQNEQNFSFSSDKMSDYKNQKHNTQGLIQWLNNQSDIGYEKNDVFSHLSEQTEVLINLNGGNKLSKRHLIIIKNDKPSKKMHCISLRNNLKSIAFAYMTHCDKLKEKEKGIISKTVFEFSLSSKNRKFQTPLTILFNQSSFSIKPNSNKDNIQNNITEDKHIETDNKINLSKDRDYHKQRFQIQNEQQQEPMYSKVIEKQINKESSEKRNPSTDAIYKKRIITETAFHLRKRTQMTIQANTNHVNNIHLKDFDDEYSLKAKDSVEKIKEDTVINKKYKSIDEEKNQKKSMNPYIKTAFGNYHNGYSIDKPSKVYSKNITIDHYNYKEQIEEQLNDNQIQSYSKYNTISKLNDNTQETKLNSLSKSLTPQIINNLESNSINNKTTTSSPIKIQKYFPNKSITNSRNPIKLIGENKKIQIENINNNNIINNTTTTIKPHDQCLINNNINSRSCLYPITEGNFIRSKSNSKIQTVYNINTEINTDKKLIQLSRNKTQVSIIKGKSKQHYHHHHNHKHGRSSTPLKLISKTAHNYYHPIKFNQAMRQSGIDTKEKIYKAVELLKEKYISYLEKVYGNDKETILSSPTIENEDFLIHDFFNSEINGDSEYLKPCESFLSQEELEHFFYHNLKFEHIKQQVNINNDFINDITRYVLYYIYNLYRTIL